MGGRALAAERGPGAVVVRGPADREGEWTARLIREGVRLIRDEAGSLLFDLARERGSGGHDEDIVDPLIHVERRIFQVTTDRIPSRGAPDARMAIALGIVSRYVAVNPAVLTLG